MTLRGPTVAADFQKIVIDYIERRFGTGSAGTNRGGVDSERHIAMRRISSRMTFFYKRVFPAFWFGFLILFVGIFSLSVCAATTVRAIPFLVVVRHHDWFRGYFIMKKLVFDLVDEVWDDGDSLVVKNRGEEERIAFTDIKNVSYSPFMNPPRVTVSLRRRQQFRRTDHLLRAGALRAVYDAAR